MQYIECIYTECVCVYRMYFSEILYKDDLYQYDRGPGQVLTSYSSYSSFHEHYGSFTPHKYKSPIDASRSFIIHKVRDFPTEHRVTLPRSGTGEQPPAVLYRRNINQYDLQGYFRDIPSQSFQRDEEGDPGGSDVGVGARVAVDVSSAHSSYMRQMERTALIKELMEEQAVVQEQLRELGRRYSGMLRLLSDGRRFNVLCSEYGLLRRGQIYPGALDGLDSMGSRVDAMFTADQCKLANMSSNVYSIEEPLYSTLRSICK